MTTRRTFLCPSHLGECGDRQEEGEPAVIARWKKKRAVEVQRIYVVSLNVEWREQIPLESAFLVICDRFGNQCFHKSVNGSSAGLLYVTVCDGSNHHTIATLLIVERAQELKVELGLCDGAVEGGWLRECE
jgi:hypothetical protein